jgi:hypothetical protein
MLLLLAVDSELIFFLLAAFRCCIALVLCGDKGHPFAKKFS